MLHNEIISFTFPTVETNSCQYQIDTPYKLYNRNFKYIIQSLRIVLTLSNLSIFQQQFVFRHSVFIIRFSFKMYFATVHYNLKYINYFFTSSIFLF